MPEFRSLILLGLSLGVSHAQPKYAFAILDTGRNIQIRDMNDSGVAVGSYQIDTSDPFRAFVFKDGSFKELGDFGGGQSTADEINNQGVIVGTAQNTIKEKRPFYRERDTLFEIMPYPGEFGLSINAKGLIAGYTVGYNVAADRGYLFDHGLIKLLPKQFRPAAINDSGIMVGQAEGRGAIYRGDSLMPLPLPPGFTYVDAVDINNRGQVAGSASRGDSVAAFIFENGAYRWLPALGGKYTRAVAINDRGQVVGTSSIQDKAAPFLYENGQAYALQDLAGASLGTWLQDVSCINNKGQIAAYAQKGPMIHDWVAVILTPSASTTGLKPVAGDAVGAARSAGARNKAGTATASASRYRVDGRSEGPESGSRSAGIRLRRNLP